MRIPLVVGFGGINSAGRSSGHHGYRRLVLDALGQAERARTLQSLKVLMGSAAHSEQAILDHTLIRRIEAQLFDTEQIPWNKRMSFELAGQPLRFTTKARNLPEPLPPGWQVEAGERGEVTVTVSLGGELLVPSLLQAEVRAAGQLPSGFDPGTLYASRNHPRGLQMTIFGASDALGNLGIDWQTVCDRVRPEQISVYAGSGMSQLDGNGNGGMMAARFNGKRVTSKQCPFGFAEMPADFINAYVLGSLGNTGTSMGACASFLYNLRLGLNDIESGRARVVLVGNAEAPIASEVMEGYAAMGALASDKELRALDGLAADIEPNYRRACRPFSDNCGFTIAESAQFVVLMDDELALELGATVYGAVTDVFVNADGHKKSISAPGAGNYLTMARAAAAAAAIVGDEALRQRSFVQAHGTGTPQNRVTESHILNETARVFGIEHWPVAAIKAYLGHSIGVAAGDQLVTTLGVFAHGIIPGIATIDHVADDVYASNLNISAAHKVGQPGELDVAIINAKGFGGNNASATVLAPHVVEKLLAGKHGQAAMSNWLRANEAVRERSAAYDEQANAGHAEPVYKFDHQVIQPEQIEFTREAIRVPGYAQTVDLQLESPLARYLKG